jgi:periplasmic protein TonB
MKTKRNFQTLSIMRTIVVLSLISVAVIVFSSCGKNKSADPKSSVETAAPSEAALRDSVFLNVDEMPVFTGGDTALLSYIGKNTVYPVDAKTAGVQGKVVVRFVVERDGSISHVAVIKSVSPSVDAEAVRVVSSLPKFEKPGFIKSTPVAVHYMVPITFTLK